MTTNSEDLDVLIIGGGISGLATAWWLAQTGLRVQVWEKSERAGGKIKTNRQNGFQTEQAASMIMNFKPEVDQFFSQSGLEQYKAKRLLGSENNRYLIHQGKLQPLPMTIAGLFFSSLWSHQGKFRLLLEPFISRAKKENESVSEFITRRLGHEFLEKAMEPFISGTLASNPDLASAQYVIPRLTALEKRFGSITAGIIAHKIMGKRTARNPESFSFKQGMETLPEHLAQDPAIGFHANIDVQELIQYKHYWQVQATSAKGEIHCKARHVVLSTPANSMSQLLKPVSSKLSQLLDTIQYAPLSVVHLGLQRTAIKHSLDSAGFLVPRREQANGKITINGNLWMSSVFSGRAPEDQVLLSSYLGGSRNPSAINLSSQQSIDQVLAGISPLLGIKDHCTPTMAKVDRHHNALPLYHGDYANVIKAIEQQLQQFEGLHIEANFKGGVSIRDRIASAKDTARQIIEQLASLQDSKAKKNFSTSFIDNISLHGSV